MKFKIKNKKSFILKVILILIITSVLIFTVINIKANAPVSEPIAPVEKLIENSVEPPETPPNNSTEQSKNNSNKKEKPLSKEAATPVPSGNAMSNYDFTSWNKTCEQNLIVINKNNKIPDNFNLSLCNVGNMQVSTVIKPHLDRMFNDAKQNGISLWVASGYRNVSRQTTLFNNIVSEYLNKKYPKSEAERLAATRVARPYTSEHHTGFAVDLNDVNSNFSKSKAFDWLIKNSAKYGFVLRYNHDKTDITCVIYEPWHFRYVGIDHATAMNQKNMCLEEYVISLINK